MGMDVALAAIFYADHAEIAGFDRPAGTGDSG
jgi:hypothetical protein